MEQMKQIVVCGSCESFATEQPDGCVNLIVTSPPYAERRKQHYGGVAAKDYPDWFRRAAEDFQRILADDGSFVLNIKEHVEDGQRSLYVMKTLEALVEKDGWRFVDEFVWHKSNPVPGKWKSRLKDGFERCFHFSKTKDVKFRPDNIKEPVAETTKKHRGRDKRTETDHVAARNGYRLNSENMNRMDLVIPSNVFTAGVGGTGGFSSHAAVFPKKLPERFIKLLTDEGDWVYDPFLGSGTTLLVAKELGRNSIGTERLSEYARLARIRLGKVRDVL